MFVKRWLDYLNGHSDKLEGWQRGNPSKPHKDFYAKSVEFKLRKGRPHKTLGGNLLNHEYGSSGRGFTRKLAALGLKQEDTCVDYGCGTLRLGIHAIAYLQPGAYWGMDISDFLLEEGRKLIGESLWKKKQPHLRVISAESVAEAAAAKPTILFSSKVLIHVHPADLQEYFQNIIRIVGTSGVAIITGKWSDRETLRYSKLSWAHSLAIVQELVELEGGSMSIIDEQECRLKHTHINQTVRSGTLRIVRAGGVAPA